MPSARPRRVAVFVQLEIEHGQGILRGIAQTLRRHPHITVLKYNRTTGYDSAALRRERFDGIIAKVGTPADERTLRQLRVPVVNTSGQCATPALPVVNTDDRTVGRLAAGHLLARGYAQLAYCGNRAHLASQLRLRGLQEETARRGGPKVLTAFLPFGDQVAPYSEKQRVALQRWLRTLPRQSGVFCFTDRVALEIDEACAALGLRVPEDIGILGVGNDLTRLAFAHTDISSIQLNAPAIGALAAEAMLQAFAGKPPSPGTVLIAPRKIITRKSTDHFAIDDEVVTAALDHMRENAGNDIYVDEVARNVGVSRRALELRFRRALKSSVYAEAQRLHFERAIELMADEHLTLGEIAYASGFGSSVIFSTMFRRRYAETPSAYRERLLGRALREEPAGRPV